MLLNFPVILCNIAITETRKAAYVAGTTVLIVCTSLHIIIIVEIYCMYTILCIHTDSICTLYNRSSQPCSVVCANHNNDRKTIAEK